VQEGSIQTPGLAVLGGRTVVLGVSGGIAAYKAAELCRRLVEAGAHVVPVLSASATRFVGEATFSALASEPARTSIWNDADPIPHTRLGQAADVVVVAPATAHLVARYAAGMADDLLSATLLATRSPVVLCPAMHTEMWEHPAVQENLWTLRARGVHVVDPGVGRLAGGDVGPGRLAEPQAILERVAAALSEGRPVERSMSGIRVLVTAGGTREPMDPVRFIGNRSSGKQGHAIAEEAAERGAAVTLVTASALPAPRSVETVRVETAAEMAEAVLPRVESSDVIVMAAAVADFRPKQASASKIRKEDGVPEMVLEPTEDILAEVGKRRSARQVVVGFAAETAELEKRAEHKRARKGADIMVANDVSAPSAGFDHDTNSVVVLGEGGERWEVGLTRKRAVAAAVLDAVSAQLERRRR
jgi:phosphopantothenoylcysteine decarboxylase/phosphopantothenate--cysteine ligase